MTKCCDCRYWSLMMVKNFNVVYIGGLQEPKSILTSALIILGENMMIGIVNILMVIWNDCEGR